MISIILGDILYHNYEGGDCFSSLMTKSRCQFSTIVDLGYRILRLGDISQVNGSVELIICSASLGIDNLKSLGRVLFNVRELLKVHDENIVTYAELMTSLVYSFRHYTIESIISVKEYVEYISEFSLLKEAMDIVVNSISFEDAVRKSFLQNGTEELIYLTCLLAESRFAIPDNLYSYVLRVLPQYKKAIFERYERYGACKIIQKEKCDLTFIPYILRNKVNLLGSVFSDNYKTLEQYYGDDINFVTPDIVTEIGDYAFLRCSANITISESIREIGIGAFSGFSGNIICKSPYYIMENNALLTASKDRLINLRSDQIEYTIPEGVVEIGDSAFSQCGSLKNVYIPDSVIRIGGRAFYKCSSLEKIIIPKFVQEIDIHAFGECMSLKSIECIDNRCYKTIDNVLYTANNELVCFPLGLRQTEFVVPNIVTSIAPFAFASSSLEDIQLPDAIMAIGDSAFSDCFSLKSLQLPDGITAIGNHAFSGCSSLKSLQLPDGITAIGNHAFSGCSSLKNIQLPNGITVIGDFAFWGCSSLKSLQLPDGVTAIGNHAFSGCSSLRNIQLPDGITTIGNHAFWDCSSLKSLQLPDGVTDVGNHAFSGCSSLRNIHLPDSVTAIGDHAFSGCSSLKSLHLPDGITAIGDHAFSGCPSLKSLHLPDGITSIGDHAFSGCSSLKSIQLPDGIMAIGDYAFSGCSSLKSIQLPDSIIEIGSFAFRKTSLKEIYIPNSVRKFGYGMFDQSLEVIYSDKLIDGVLYNEDRTEIIYFPRNDERTEYSIPDSVLVIAPYAFAYCSSLQHIYMSDMLKVIGDWAFVNCSSLKHVRISESVIEIGARAFEGCSSLEYIEIPQSVVKVGGWIFSNCLSLKIAKIPKSVKMVEPFIGCSSLNLQYDDKYYLDGIVFNKEKTEIIRFPNNRTEYSIPSSVIKIERYAFVCSSLEKLDIPEGVADIEFRAFFGSSLKSIRIPNSITRIAVETFSDCTSLQTVVLPDTITIIENGVFSGCSSLKTIRIPDSVVEIKDGAFRNCSLLENIQISDSVKIGKEVFEGCPIAKKMIR